MRGARARLRTRASAASSFAQYVTTMSAPARRIAVSVSSAACRSSSSPAAAAALIIAYSPETLYAASGRSKRSRTARITSRYGSAGLTISTSAPSATSSSHSRSASRTFAGIHLVAAPVAERRRRAGGLAERPVERRGVLGRVGDDRRLGQLGADRGDPAVHHVARADGVGAGLGVARPRCARSARATRRCRPRRRAGRRSGRATCTRRGTRRSAAAARGSGRRSARSACWTIPSALHAPEASSSFSSGIPNRITALMPARTQLLALAHEPRRR